MHELGLMMSVFDAVRQVARDAGATRVLRVRLSVGEMTDALAEPLSFAYEMLSEGDELFGGSELALRMVPCRSRCNACGAEYAHERFALACPECGSFDTQLTAGRELQIDDVEVELPD